MTPDLALVSLFQAVREVSEPAASDEGFQFEVFGRQRKYLVRDVDLEPHVYWRITDNWLELTVRFLTGVYGVRGSRPDDGEVLGALDAEGIAIASATLEINAVPAPSAHDRSYRGAP